MLNETTTRDEFLTRLRASHQNIAVRKHLAQVEVMDQKTWELHRQYLINMRREAGPAIARMVKEIEKSTGQGSESTI
jgi:hypothetical protein